MPSARRHDLYAVPVLYVEQPPRIASAWRCGDRKRGLAARGRPPRPKGCIRRYADRSSLDVSRTDGLLCFLPWPPHLKLWAQKSSSRARRRRSFLLAVAVATAGGPSSCVPPWID
ncbi:hypothetical protein ZWY2020_044540 [Hordeum vulgare]|nr:hypothetical protein ZWY2020_044540 [Hordeum vulgare]